MRPCRPGRAPVLGWPLLGWPLPGWPLLGWPLLGLVRYWGGRRRSGRDAHDTTFSIAAT